LDKPKAEPAPSRRRRWKLIAGVAIASAYALAAGWYLWTKLSPHEPSPEEAVVSQLTDQPGQELFPSLSPDGKSFAYSANGHILVQRVGEKSSADLTKDSADQNWQPAFSPDGQRIAFRSERDGGGIFVMPAAGGPARRLTDFGYNPAWSPDGKEILCATDTFLDPSLPATSGSTLWAVNVSTGAKRQLTDPKTVADAVYPSWSPHAQRIAYSNMQGGHPTIWTVSASGNDPVQVLQESSVTWNPAWSPDGRYLYFASDRRSEMELWRVRIEEKSGKPIGQPEHVAAEAGFNGFISLARDGKRIAYLKSLRSGNIQKVAFDPSKEAVIGQPAPVTHGARLAFGPALSPDGRWFAFFSWGKVEDVFLASFDGRGPWGLTNDVHSNRWPRWSPDGKQIAFQSDRTGRFQIWTMHADGSSLEQLTYSPEPAVNPVWSPDGKYLAYSTERNCFIMSTEMPWVDQNLTPLPGWSDGSSHFEAFSWSPDGTRLAGHLRRATDDPDRAGIVTYSLQERTYHLVGQSKVMVKGRAVQVTNAGTFPLWLSDSRRLMYASQDKILLADTASGKTHEILSTAPPVFFGLSSDDRLLYFTKIVVEADIWLSTLK
jgi:eukaryotic-like serine/threonine-protein kinase